MVFADIIVDISHENIDKAFQYIIPPELVSQVKVGDRVDIPFGNRKDMTGYIVGFSQKPQIDESRLKPIWGLSSKAVALEGRSIMLAEWIRAHFGGTMNECLKTVLPVKKTVRPVVKKEVVAAVDKDAINAAAMEAAKKKHVAKERLLNALLSGQPIDYSLIKDKLNISPQTLTSLEKAGIIKIISTRMDRGAVFSEYEKKQKPVLNEEQQQAVRTFTEDYDAGKRGTYLLHGVTGSGKTEVYLEMIEYVVAQGKQAIVLIPEISLTFQTIRRFTERFGDRVAYFNSRLSAGERFDQYMKAKEGDIDIIIGPRSALFTPFKNPGIIIIDEEHEGSYKSEGAPKYHAREVAIELAGMTEASVVLGSATPSVESYKRAKDGTYTLLTMKKRAKEASLPTVSVVDMREELKKKNRTIFSTELASLMADRLAKNQQIMLFLNRRGYSGFVSCRACGEAIKCPHCEVTLTEHYDGKMRCHYCGYTIIKPRTCPKCQSTYIGAFGTGTQKIEEGVHKLFPEAKVLRMDADTTREKDSYDKILSAFQDREADILIGTQMIVKGHDFPGVTLMGVLAADLSLFASDYRAPEKTFQLLAQAAGRAGRDKLPGNVVIQTYQPEHYAVINAAAQDYESFYNQEIGFRRLMKYPPEGHIISVLFEGKSEDRCRKACTDLAAELMLLIKERQEERGLTVLGPSPAGISKINDVYRCVIYYKHKNEEVLQKISRDFFEKRETLLKTGVQITVDMDPMNVY